MIRRSRKMYLSGSFSRSQWPGGSCGSSHLSVNSIVVVVDPYMIDKYWMACRHHHLLTSKHSLSRDCYSHGSAENRLKFQQQQTWRLSEEVVILMVVCEAKSFFTSPFSSSLCPRIFAAPYLKWSCSAISHGWWHFSILSVSVTSLQMCPNMYEINAGHWQQAPPSSVFNVEHAWALRSTRHSPESKCNHMMIWNAEVKHWIVEKDKEIWHLCIVIITAKSNDWDRAIVGSFIITVIAKLTFFMIFFDLNPATCCLNNNQKCVLHSNGD